MVVYSGGLDRQALREKYLAFFPLRTSNPLLLQEVVKGLVALGFSRSTLAEWAMNAGYSAAYVRSHLSRIFCALGLRERGVGAGRKLSPDAAELLDHARCRYGARFLKVLRAALRAGKSQMASSSRSQSQLSGEFSRITGPQLVHTGANGRTLMRRPVAGKILKRKALTQTKAGTKTRTKPL